MSIWATTKKVPIVARLKLAAARREAEDAVLHADFIASVRSVIAAREADERFHVTLKYVGAKDDGTAPDTGLFAEIEAKESSAVFQARLRARKLLTSLGEPMDEKAVDSATGRDPQWMRDSREIAKAWLLAGVVGGEPELQRINDLGLEDGGQDGARNLLGALVDEVKLFNSMPAEKKST